MFAVSPTPGLTLTKKRRRPDGPFWWFCTNQAEPPADSFRFDPSGDSLQDRRLFPPFPSFDHSLREER